MRLYEGMFIIDNAVAVSDWDSVVKQVQSVLENRGAEILSTEKWGEKKLAYIMNGHKRGTYLLIYFNAPVDSISTIKRDFQLSDNVLRTLIVRTDKIKEPTPEDTEENQEKPDTVASEDTEENQEKPATVASE